jgi:hypothetical protein
VVGVALAIAMGGFALGAVLGTAQAGAKVGPNGPIDFEKQVFGDSYKWTLTGVPDIDMRRANNDASGAAVQGLPSNGKNWCAPTSGADILAYLADLGFNTGIPSKNWTLPENYNEMTTLLQQLGDEMGTTGGGGTKGLFDDVMKAHLAAAGSELAGIDSAGVGQYVSYSISGHKGPSAEQLAFAGLDGAVGILTRNKYHSEPDPDGTGTVLTGGRGHVMVLAGASGYFGAGGANLQVNDPATPDADTVQGPYDTEPHTVGPPTSVKWIDKDNGNTQQLTLSTWDGSPVDENGTTRWWTGYYVIAPNTTWVQLGLNLKRIRPYPLVPDPGPLKTVYDVPGKRPVSDLALLAGSASPAFLVKGSNQVRSLNPVTGTSTTLARVRGAEALEFGGPSQQLFVAGGRKLVALDGLSGQVLASRKLKKPLGALAFDETAGLLVGLTAGAGRVQFFDEGLRSRGARALDGLEGKAKGKARREPLLEIAPNGKLFVGLSGSPSVFSAKSATRLASAAGGTATASRAFDLKRRFRAKKGIHGLTVDDLGHILVSQGGKVTVFDKKGHRLPSRFAGRASAVFDVTRPSTHVDPSLQTAIDFPDDEAP